MHIGDWSSGYFIHHTGRIADASKGNQRLTSLEHAWSGTVIDLREALAARTCSQNTFILVTPRTQREFRELLSRGFV